MGEASSRNAWGKKIALFFWFVITLIPIVGLFFSIFQPIPFYNTQAEWREFAERFATWGPILFIGLQALQVIVAPISHYSVGYMGGFLYGTWWGSLYNYIGRIIGHICAFWLSRLLGRRIADRFVRKATIEKYDRLVSGQSLILFFIYFLPLFPDDEISYLAGLSRMEFRWFLLANLFGQVGGSVSLAYMGSGIDTNDATFWVLTVATVLGFPLLWVVHRLKTRQRSASEGGA